MRFLSLLQISSALGSTSSACKPHTESPLKQSHPKTSRSGNNKR